MRMVLGTEGACLAASSDDWPCVHRGGTGREVDDADAHRRKDKIDPGVRVCVDDVRGGSGGG